MAKPFGGVATMDGSADSIANYLGLTPDESEGMFYNLSIQANAANGADVYIGGSTVTGATDAWAVLPAGSSYAFLLENTAVNLNSLYLIGTASDTVHILAVQ